MTGLTHIHQCPRCELRFTSTSELEYHLSNDHRPRRPVEDVPAIVIPPAVVPAAPPPPVRDIVNTASGPRNTANAARGSRRVGTTLAVIGAAMIVLAAVFTSTLTTAIVIGLVLVLIGCYVWRANGRRRHRDTDASDGT
jgi:hypothetical protein